MGRDMFPVAVNAGAYPSGDLILIWTISVGSATSGAADTVALTVPLGTM